MNEHKTKNDNYRWKFIYLFHPMIPPNVRRSSPFVNATHPRQSHCRVPWAFDSIVHGIVWWSSSFHGSSLLARVNRCTAKRLAESIPVLAGNSMHVVYASVFEKIVTSASDTCISLGLAPSARQSFQESIRPPNSITSDTSFELDCE